MPNMDAVGLGDLVTVMKISNQNMSQLIQTIKAVIPYIQSTATGATGGSRSLPANPAGFLVVTDPTTGSSVKVPYYNP